MLVKLLYRVHYPLYLVVSEYYFRMTTRIERTVTQSKIIFPHQFRYLLIIIEGSKIRYIYMDFPCYRLVAIGAT